MTQQDDLRYPVGRFSAPAGSIAGVRSEYIQTLRALPDHLQAAVSGLNDAQLDTPYREDGWTVRQVVHHVADSHANSYVRFKLALTEDWPPSVLPTRLPGPTWPTAALCLLLRLSRSSARCTFAG